MMSLGPMNVQRHTQTVANHLAGASQTDNRCRFQRARRPWHLLPIAEFLYQNVASCRDPFLKRL